MSKFMNSSYGCGIQEIDAAKIATSFGCDGYTVRSPKELIAAIDSALERRRPTVIDVKVIDEQLEDVMLPNVEKMVGRVYGRQ